ncbi:MAG: hypothetical protein OEM67_04990 [Thermoleophilia bacterium]|nr:hypothetical protein [Thermoleophilia bacterium]MDH3724591.1 hypothetical protein [Thermoleophilia bacterium]
MQSTTPMTLSQPEPTYTLAPEVENLDPEQRRALDAVTGYLSGRVGGAIVVRVVTTEQHHVFELETSLGPVLVLERNRP